MKDNLKAKRIYGNDYSLIETDKSRTPSLKHLKEVEQQNKLEQFSEKEQRPHFSVFGKYRHPIIRFGLFMFGVIVSTFGVNSIINGDMTYKNHYELTVFGPFSIIIGILCIYVAIFKWKNVKEDL